jgi:hypothetical protein
MLLFSSPLRGGDRGTRCMSGGSGIRRCGLAPEEGVYAQGGLMGNCLRHPSCSDSNRSGCQTCQVAHFLRVVPDQATATSPRAAAGSDRPPLRAPAMHMGFKPPDSKRACSKSLQRVSPQCLLPPSPRPSPFLLYISLYAFTDMAPFHFIHL